LILQNKSGRMVALHGGKYDSSPLIEVGGGARPLDVDQLYDAEQYRPKIRNVEGKPMFLY
jgi:6-phosphofructokinase 1